MMPLDEAIKSAIYYWYGTVDTDMDCDEDIPEHIVTFLEYLNLKIDHVTLRIVDK